MFRPKVFDTIQNYSRSAFINDAVAGVIVGIVALPLAIAFAIASGVSPEKGLFTAIIAGFVISAFGGSKVQIGGPTGAFIVVVYGIVQQFGIEGLLIATFMAGILLVMMGMLKLGNVIKYIPYPLIVGFTAGIALIIFSSQIKDFFGLEMGPVPADFIDKWREYGRHIQTINLFAVALGISTVLIISLWPKVSRRIPGSLVAILATTATAIVLKLPVETIGSRFGVIPSGFPDLQFPSIEPETVRVLLKPAITIALLGGIESLLSAVVADGMTGGNHRSNTELIGQGIANICSSIFGGIPATGAIARTATNIKNGGRTPVAGIIHAATLLVILLFVGKWAALIPMATLAGILVIVAAHMSEVRNVIAVTKGSRSDATVMGVTFLLTVVVDLTVAIEAGMVLAAFLFLRKMMQSSSVEQVPDVETGSVDGIEEVALPAGVDVFEINGPFFFGAAYKFKDAMRIVQKPGRVLILRMKNVSIIDATGIRVLRDVNDEISRHGTKLILAEVTSEQVLNELKKTRLMFRIGKANIKRSFGDALLRAEKIIGNP